MAYKIRLTSQKEYEDSKFKNKSDLLNFWSYMVKTFKDSASFAIDDKDSKKIKVMPNYETNKGKIQIQAKRNNLNLYFGKGSDNFKISGSGDDKTTLQEVGYLVLLDMLLSNQKDISTYKPTTRLIVKANIENVINFLETNKDWYDSSLSGAKKTISEFGASNLKKYNFHHDDDLFNKIRTLGLKISGLSNKDKWNPADVYLIKKWKPDTTNIITFNNYIEKSGDVIGISLKKSPKEALHGAVALNVIAAEFGFNKFSAKYKEINDLFVKDMKRYITKLKNHPLKNIMYVTIENKNLTESLKNLKPESKNYFKSLPPAIEFLSETNENLIDVLKFSIMTAMSISPKSCGHWKLEGGSLSYQPTDFEIEILKIRLKLNGNTDTIFDFKFNGKQMKLQLRSKGSLPQFIIIKTAEEGKDLLKINELKIN